MSNPVDWELYAQLSDVVYNRGAGNEPLNLPADAVRVGQTRDGAFYGEIYRVSGNYVVAIRGTDGASDWYANIENGLGADFLNNQFADTLSLVREAQQLAQDPGGTVTITGHSLGGGLAAEAAVSLRSVYAPSLPRLRVGEEDQNAQATW